MKKPRVSLEEQLAGHAPPQQTVAATEAAPPAIKLRPTQEKSTVYLPRGAVKRIKQMGLDNDRNLNDYLREGVDLMLAKYGEPSLKEFEGK